MALKIDELNNLTSTKKKKKRAIPYRQYFEEMELDEEQIEERVEHSKKLAPILFFIITLILMLIEADDEEESFLLAEEELKEMYLELLEEEKVAIDDELKQYVEDFAKEFVETTVRRITDDSEDTEDNFFTSEDRAELVAENEANTVFNYEEFREAVATGAVYKMWVTEKDNRVRDTHKAVDSTAIPILDYFEVGDALMRFPKDTSMGASLEEIANCRCRIEYIKTDA